jgi:hypothetical protein
MGLHARDAAWVAGLHARDAARVAGLRARDAARVASGEWVCTRGTRRGWPPVNGSLACWGALA